MVKIDKEELEDIVDHLESLEVPYKYIKAIHKYFLDKLDESSYNEDTRISEGNTKKRHLGLVPPMDLFDGY